MDPSGPSQPSKTAAYETKGNPTTLNPVEKRAAECQPNGKTVDERHPPSQAHGQKEGQPASSNYGIRGAPPGEEQYGRTEENVGRHRELDGEQMRGPGEGDVADAERRKPGASGSQPDFASELDRKKAEQASQRQEVKNAKRDGIFSDGGDPRARVDT